MGMTAGSIRPEIEPSRSRELSPRVAESARAIYVPAPPREAQGADPVAIDVESLKSERDRLKSQLRDLETEQRRLEAELKTLRQREIRGKREVEALSTLIELHEPKNDVVETSIG
jgi:hypothetical protein